MIVTPRSCFFPGCARFAEHRHHIVYFPEEVVKPLCEPHHKEITMLNGQQARKCRHPLSNNHRWWIWNRWLEGKLRPRRTRKALEYVEEWDRVQAAAVIALAQSEEGPASSPDAPRKMKRKKAHKLKAGTTKIKRSTKKKPRRARK